MLGFGPALTCSAESQIPASTGASRSTTPAHDPLYTVHCTESWGTCEVEGSGPDPERGEARGWWHGHMAVIDQAGSWEYDFWQVLAKPAGGGTITISWVGRTRNDR